jgi:hypothetical protein
MMPLHANRRTATLAIAALGVYSMAVNQAAAADPPVALKKSPPVAKNVDAFPRIAAPADPAAQRINQALDRRDAQVKTAAKECSNGDWERAVSVPMRGPRYLALTAQDSWDCGGPHPDDSLLVLVYDLSTGSPVNWTRLLPASMVQTSTLDTAGDGTKIGVIGSRVLQDFYIKALSSDPKNPLNPDCHEVLNEPDLKFNVWPDAKAGGIAIQPEGLAHVLAPCVSSVVVPISDLRKMGVQPALLDAIESAHAHRWHDEAGGPKAAGNPDASCCCSCSGLRSSRTC